MSLPTDLQDIFSNPSQLQRLKAFAASTFCEENIIFLEQVLFLKTQNPNKPKTAELINVIVSKFINKDSPSQVNIDSALQAQIIETARNITLQGIQNLNLFDEAFRHVANTVQRDTLQRFKLQNSDANVVVNRRTTLTDSRNTRNTTSNSSILSNSSTISTSTANSASVYAASIHSSLDSVGSSNSSNEEKEEAETEEDLRNSWYRGHLLRRKGFFGQWKPFTYTKKGKYLFEFKPGANHVTSEPLETMYLENCLVEPAKTLTGKSHSFILNTHDGKGYFFQAASDDEMQEWIEELSHFSVSKRNLRFLRRRRNSIKSNHSSGSDHSGTSHTSGADSVTSYDSQSSHPSSLNSTNTHTSNPSASASASSSTNNFHSSSNINFTSSPTTTTPTITTTPLSPTSPNNNQTTTTSNHHYSPMVVLEGEELIKALPILHFLESFTDAVVVGDSRGLIVAFNSPAERMFGLSKAEAVGASLKLLMPAPYSTFHDSYMFQYEKHGQMKLIGKTRNLKGLRKNGDVFDLQISLGKLPVHGYFIATIRELTQAQANDED